jgi:hypothetical protein
LPGIACVFAKLHALRAGPELYRAGRFTDAVEKLQEGIGRKYEGTASDGYSWR